MVKKLLFFLALCLSTFPLHAQSKRTIPYPILFVHGWGGSDETWYNEIQHLRQQGLNASADEPNKRAGYGTLIEFNLNADGNIYTSFLNRYGSSGNYGDVRDMQSFINPNNDVFVINFKIGNMSNQSAAVKQGFAVGLAVKRILENTGADKIVLFGHSMGGIAIREYVQNKYNWIYDTGDHHVAKVITSGTPHNGSNATFFNLVSLMGMDERSEAVRDLRTNIPGNYLWGGYEGSISNYYQNKDINSNGYENDYITGLNQKPIYTNIAYTSIIGIGGNNILGHYGPNGDDIVSTISADLSNIYKGLNYEKFVIQNDTKQPTNSFEWSWHTRLTKQTFANQYALDEPALDELAYEISLNKQYNAFFTPHSDAAGSDFDVDKFKINIKQRGILSIFTNHSGRVFLYDQSTFNVTLDPTTLKATIPRQGYYYITMSGSTGAESGAPFHFVPYTFSTSFCPLPELPKLSVSEKSICEGETITLSIDNSGYDSYQWFRGNELVGTGASFQASKDGEYYVSGSKCGVNEKSSNTTKLTVKPKPTKPVINPTVDGLNAGIAAEYQWMLNGTAISGGTNQNLIGANSGTYTVKVTENGCSSISDPFTITGIEDLDLNTVVFPNPSNGNFEVKTDLTGKLQFVLTDMQGKKLSTFHKKDIETKQVPGLYLLRIESKSRKVTKKILIE